MKPWQLTKRIVIAVGALGVGGLAALLWLGAGIVLSESHAANPTMVWHLKMAFFVALGALLWSIFVLVTVIRRGSRRDFAALAAAAVCQVYLFYLGTQYDIVREWTAVPVTVEVIASMSVALGWLLALPPGFAKA